MRPLYKVRLRLRSLLRRPGVERELDDEFQFHLDQLTQEKIAEGMAPDEARFSARRAMGGVSQYEEECRDMRRVNFIEDMARDLRYGGRNLRRNPGFTILAVLILALGIGANTAVFSVVNSVLLRPLQYRDPDRIVTVTNPPANGDDASGFGRPVSIPNFQDWHDRGSSFEAMAYYQSFEAAILTGGAAEYVPATRVSPEFFRVLGVDPVAGRGFSPDDMKLGAGALLISYAYWQSHFGGDPRAIGQTIRLIKPLPIVGVMPPGFHFPDKTDLWYPTNTIFREPTADLRGAQNYLAVGRLREGVSLERAQSEMTVIAQGLAQQYPDINKGRTVRLTRMRDDMVSDFRMTLYLLLGAVTVVLLIACANTATLLLGKATARTREVAVRVALGASHQRIVRQLFTESLLLAVIGGGLGLLLAMGGSKALVALAPAGLPRLGETAIDRWVALFAFGVSMVTTLLFGMVPAIYASKSGFGVAIRQGVGRAVAGGSMTRARGVLVAAEIALAVVLLSAGGLLIKSFLALHNVALGFRPENVLLMKATMPGAQPAARQFFRELMPKIAALPGVTAVGVSMAPPGHVESNTKYFFDHLPPQREWISGPAATIALVGPGAFAALGIPLRSGRDFNLGDLAGKPLVAVVNEALVRQSLGAANPIGRQIYCLYDSSDPMTIVGVVGDVREQGPARDPMPECYISYEQHGFRSLRVAARTAGDPAALQGAIGRVVREMSPNVPVKFDTLANDAAQGVAAPRFRTLLFGIFAGLAVSLAMAGVYGVMAYAVGRRSAEIGLRIALGASQGSVLRLILGEGLAVAAIGLAVGLAAAAALTRLLGTMLFQVKPHDPAVYAGVAFLVSLVTLAAGYLPARRAAAIDPLVALREE